jgi:hypothetical protein
MAGIVKNYAVVVNGIVAEKVLASADFFEIPPTVNGSIRSKYPSFIIVDLDETSLILPNVGWEYTDNVFVPPENPVSQETFELPK